MSLLNSNPTPGKVYLIGAGPGRADLITVRGLNILRQADVVLYDRLIAPELLDELPPHAIRVYVGKKMGQHAVRQKDIHVKSHDIGNKKSLRT